MVRSMVQRLRSTKGKPASWRAKVSETTDWQLACLRIATRYDQLAATSSARSTSPPLSATGYESGP